MSNTYGLRAAMSRLQRAVAAAKAKHKPPVGFLVVRQRDGETSADTSARAKREREEWPVTHPGEELGGTLVFCRYDPGELEQVLRNRNAPVDS